MADSILRLRSVQFFLIAALVLGVLLSGVAIVSAQGPRPGGGRAPAAMLGTGFTYQGQLKQNGALVNGGCDFQFGLWDSPNAGLQVSGTTTQTVSSVNMTNGLFTVQIDFGGNAFDGGAHWLAIATRCPTASGNYTNLVSREPVTPAPYALTALKAAYKNVIVVAKSGGHYNTITNALNSITDNSATNQYLISVAPGTYAETVTMKSYVDIEGAGELATKITQIGSPAANSGTVVGASNAELRFLTVENSGGNNYAIAIYNGAGSPHLIHVTAVASGGAIDNYGVLNAGSSPVMQDVIAAVSGTGNTDNIGVYNTSAFPTMLNVTGNASGGNNAYGVQNYSSSPTMVNVTALASGAGNFNYGVNNINSSPTMTNIAATAQGGNSAIGVNNTSLSSPTMTNVTATGSGATFSYGVSNNSASSTINNSVITGSGGANNIGIVNVATSGTYLVTVNNSQIKGGTNSVVNYPEFTLLIGGSKLDGTVVTNGGPVTCAGVYNGNYTFFANTCP